MTSNSVSRIHVRNTTNSTIFYLESGAILNNISSVRYAGEDDAVFTVTKSDGIFYTYIPINGKNVRATLEQAITRYGKTVYLVS